MELPKYHKKDANKNIKLVARFKRENEENTKKYCKSEAEKMC